MVKLHQQPATPTAPPPTAHSCGGYLNVVMLSGHAHGTMFMSVSMCRVGSNNNSSSNNSSSSNDSNFIAAAIMRS
ncbi:hypothetical protein ACLKA6_006333 [Drosophila palustris]